MYLYLFTGKGDNRDGTKCGSFVRGDRFGQSDYCRNDHDPDFDRSTSTAIFRIDNLHNDMKAAVDILRNGIDVYSEETLENIGVKQMDHVQELHTFRDVFDCIIPFAQREGSTPLIDKIKLAANVEGNLNITSEAINLSKFSAVEAFQEDYKEDRVNDNGLTHYLLNVPSSERKFSRTETANISKVMAEAHDSFVDAFEQTTTAEDEFCDIFHDMTIVKMRLR